MCECGCGELNLVAVYPIEGTSNVLAVDEYRGCRYCETPLGISLRYFNPEGQEQWVGWMPVPGEPLQADENGGKHGYGWAFPLIGQAELVKAAREDAELKDLDLTEYDSLADLLHDYGLHLLQAAMERREKPLGGDA